MDSYRPQNREREPMNRPMMSKLPGLRFCVIPAKAKKKNRANLAHGAQPMDSSRRFGARLVADVHGQNHQMLRPSTTERKVIRPMKIAVTRLLFQSAAPGTRRAIFLHQSTCEHPDPAVAGPVSAKNLRMRASGPSI